MPHHSLPWQHSNSPKQSFCSIIFKLHVTTYISKYYSIWYCTHDMPFWTQCPRQTINTPSFLHQQFFWNLYIFTYNYCSTYIAVTWKLNLNRNNSSETTIPKGNVKGTKELENLMEAIVNPIFEFPCGRYGSYGFNQWHQLIFLRIIVNDLYIMHANYTHSTMAQSHIKIEIPTLRLTHLPPNPKTQVTKWKGKQKERRTSMTFHFQLNNRVLILWPYVRCLSCTHCKTIVGPYTNCKCTREDHSTPWNWRWKKSFLHSILNQLKRGMVPKNLSNIVQSDTTDTAQTLHFSLTTTSGNGSLANEPHNLSIL